eukprot:1749458-Rhodomonas_salina.1
MWLLGQVERQSKELLRLKGELERQKMMVRTAAAKSNALNRSRSTLCTGNALDSAAAKSNVLEHSRSTVCTRDAFDSAVAKSKALEHNRLALACSVY